MKKMMGAIVLLCVLSGCIVVAQNVNTHGLEGLEYGMSKDAVTRALGQPAEVRQAAIDQKQYDVWVYPEQRRWAKRYNPMGSYYYEILFLDGSVVRWNRLQVYSQPDYQYKEPSAPENGVLSIEIFKKK